jgi:hypothetical protein
MKSTEVYRVLRDELAPVLKSLGFKRGKEFLSWTREHDGLYTVLWCQVSRDGWDDYAGSSFVVEFQRSEATGVGMPAKARKRINKLLADDQPATPFRTRSFPSCIARRKPMSRCRCRPT